VAATRTLDPLTRFRAWWLRRQGLTPATRPKSLAACLETTGWLQTSGSPNLYLSIRARMPGVSRQTIDRAIVDATAMVEVPGGHARPAVVVPAAEVALALRLYGASWDKHAASYFRSGRGNERAFGAVVSQAARALDEGPLTSGEVRARVTHPDAPEYLASALATLMIRGHVRRFPADGRLDSGSYKYELRHPDDRPDLDAEGSAADVNARAIGLMLQRHAPATVDELAWWTQLTKREIRTALAGIGAVPVPADGWAKEAWLGAADAAAWRNFTPGDDAAIVLIPHRDPFVHMRWSPSVLASRPQSPVIDLRRGRMMTLRLDEIEGGLNHHVVLDGADMVGVWEYDPAARKIQTRLWASNRALDKKVAAAAGETASFIRQQLGDFKLSAVDPPARRNQRLAFCKAG
jgi:hypothetical protein